MTLNKYELMANEFRCPICTDILVEPMWLPCMHVFCRKCIRIQVVNEKTKEKLAKCAECKASFSHRNLRENKKFQNILDLFKSFREENMLMTQMPSHFPIFDPVAAKERMIKNQQQARLLNHSSEDEMEDRKEASPSPPDKEVWQRKAHASPTINMIEEQQRKQMKEKRKVEYKIDFDSVDSLSESSSSKLKPQDKKAYPKRDNPAKSSVQKKPTQKSVKSVKSTKLPNKKRKNPSPALSKNIESTSFADKGR